MPTKRPTKSKRRAKPSRAADAHVEQRRLLQRANRAQKQIRMLVGQLRRSSKATNDALRELAEDLTEMLRVNPASAVVIRRDRPDPLEELDRALDPAAEFAGV